MAVYSRYRRGGLPERPMGADCKSVGFAFEGSNPSPATRSRRPGSQVLNTSRSGPLAFLGHVANC